MSEHRTDPDDNAVPLHFLTRFIDGQSKITAQFVEGQSALVTRFQTVELALQRNTLLLDSMIEQNKIERADRVMRLEHEQLAQKTKDQAVWIESIDKRLVEQESAHKELASEFKLVKPVVIGAVIMILVAFFGAIIALVIRSASA